MRITFNQRREVAIHEAAHYVAAVKYGDRVSSVRITPESGFPFRVGPGSGIAAYGAVVAYAYPPYCDALIDLAGPAMDAVRWYVESLPDSGPIAHSDYSAARELLRNDDEYMQCMEEAFLFAMSHAPLIQNVADKLLSVQAEDGRISDRALSAMTGWIDGAIGTDCNPYAVKFHNLTQRMARPDKVSQVAALRDKFRKQLA